MFLEVKFSIYLNRRVFVMVYHARCNTFAYIFEYEIIVNFHLPLCVFLLSD